MRDDSPTREPGIDADRNPQLVIYDDDVCAACGTKEELGICGDDILCATCEMKFAEA